MNDKMNESMQDHDQPIPEQELEALTRYVVGEMDDGERAAFERRLAGSPSLREEHALLSAALTSVQEISLSDPALTQDRRGALISAAREVHPGTARVRVWIPLAAAAAVLVTALIALQGDDAPVRVDELSLVEEATGAPPDVPAQVENALRSWADDNAIPSGLTQPSREPINAWRSEETKSASPPLQTETGSLGRAQTFEAESIAEEITEFSTSIAVEEALRSEMQTRNKSLFTLEASPAAPDEFGIGLVQADGKTDIDQGGLPGGATGQPAPGASRKNSLDGASPDPALTSLSYTFGGGGRGPGSSSAPERADDGSRGARIDAYRPPAQGPGSPGPLPSSESRVAPARTPTQAPVTAPSTARPEGEVRLRASDASGSFDRFAFAEDASGHPEEAGDRTVDATELVDQVLSQLARHPGETPDMMFFRYWGDNPSVQTRQDPLSTFALDVDTASFSLIRNYLSRGVLPPKAAVRTEEFINAFDYHLAPPTSAGDLFALHTEVGPSPFGAPGMKLLRVGLKAREVAAEARKPVALTFVLDVSGSMERENRLELVKQSLKLLVSQLDERDTIGIVTFQSSAQQVLAPHSMQHRQLILAAIDSLSAGGSTNAGDGLTLGYRMALSQFQEDGENRILLCSDGVANTGITDVDGILTSVERYREGRIYLNSVGVGMGNHNDALLEQLADRGDGFYAYVDTLEEAKRVFVDDLVGTLQTVAGEARAQVEFHPEAVTRYRLLGYENRAVADQDFRSTSIDAGEIGAGHEVTALYELECVENTDAPYATVRVFAQDASDDEWVEQTQDVVGGARELGQTSSAFRLAAAVAEFAELLRQSIHARGGSLGDVLALAEPLVAELDGDADVAGFVALVKQAVLLPDLLPARTELTRALDELKRNQHLKAVLDDLQQTENDRLLKQIQQQNDDLEQKIRELLEQQVRGNG